MNTFGVLKRSVPAAGRTLEVGLERLLRWRAFPGAFQWPLLGGLAFPVTSSEQWAATEGIAPLTLREIATVPERVFTWEFPLTGG